MEDLPTGRQEGQDECGLRWQKELIKFPLIFLQR